MAQPSRVRLLEVEPDIGRFLTHEERTAALELELRVAAVDKGEFDVRATLEKAGAFSAIVLDGLLLHRQTISGHSALRLLGPGDLLSLTDAPRAAIVAGYGCRATVRTQIALLGGEVLLAVRRWPRLVAGLQLRMGEQQERLATQLAICQLPRVEDRLLSLMWLLSESWGQVTATGTRLRLELTHEALGAMVGARRPTVTLALGALAADGAIVRQGRGWLLLERPSSVSAAVKELDDPIVLDDSPTSWSGAASVAPPRSWSTELNEAIARLREDHIRQVRVFHERMDQVRTVREACTDTRRRVAEARLSRRAAPSS
jgi:CRP-like cAMP-binding protein